MIFKDIIIHRKDDSLRATRTREFAVIFGVAFFILFVVTTVYLMTTGLRLKSTLTTNATQGFQKIIAGAVELHASHFDKADGLFDEAQSIFKRIKTTTWFVSPKIPFFELTDPQFEAGNALVTAGSDIARAGQNFTTVTKNLSFLPKAFFEENGKDFVPGRPSLTAQLKAELPRIEEASSSLLHANAEMQTIPMSFVPTALREKFRFAKDALSSVSTVLGDLQQDLPAMLTLLGDRAPHTYLVLLQNNAELRPTGGFIGNVMIVETYQGYLTKNRVSDVYSFDHQLGTVIEPPYEIKRVSPQWFLRDSNYSAHFPLSAQKAAWFLEKERGPGVDTVIAVDQSLITEILGATGPISIPELKKPLTGENFANIISYVVESKLSGRADPKAILKSFMPVFQKALFTHIEPTKLMPLLTAAIEGKHILAYSKDPAVEDFFVRHGVAGHMKTLEPKEDYLNVVHTSIGGNKTDAYTTEDITHDTYLNANGEMHNIVTITRTNTWDSAAELRLRKLVASFGLPPINKVTLSILGGARNLHALRIYVPKGAVLENSTGAQEPVQTIYDSETDKTYFSAVMAVETGTAQSVQLKYKLPFTLDLDPVDKYSLTVQKQAGQDRITFKKRIIPDSGIFNYKYIPAEGSFDADGVWSVQRDLTKDLTLSSIWGK